MKTTPTRLFLCIGLTAVLILSGCDIIPPDVVPHSNENDPDNENYSGPTLPVAVLSGTPAASTMLTSISITVDGAGVTAYKYSLDGGVYSDETNISVPIGESELSLGDHSLSVIGKNSEDLWQWESRATTFNWTIVEKTDFTPPDSIDITAFSSSYISGGTALGVDWPNPAEYVLLLRSISPIGSDVPTDDTAYNPGDTLSGCTVLYTGDRNSYRDESLTAEGLYFYRAFAYDDSYNYAAGGQQRVINVFVDAVYVHFNGDDADSGISTAPLRTIQAGIDRAVEVGGIYEVRVAGSTSPNVDNYDSIDPAEPIAVMASGISLYGGYDPSDWTAARDPATFITRISYGYDSYPNDQCKTVVSESLTAPVTLDGFRISGADTYSAASGWTHAVSIANSDEVFTITDCDLTGGSTTNSGIVSYGIEIWNADALITNNRRIWGGSGEGYSRGIDIAGTSSDVTISDNINGYDCISSRGTPNNQSYGIYVDGMASTAGPDITIENSHIRGVRGSGSSAGSTGVHLEGCSAVVRNCRIESESSSNTRIGYGVHIKDTETPDSVQVYNCHILSSRVSSSMHVYGVMVDSANVEFYNNNIGAGPPGSGFTASAIRIYTFNTYDTAIENNSLYGITGSGTFYGVQEGTNGTIDSFGANNFFACTPYYDDDTTTPIPESQINANPPELPITADNTFDDLTFDDDGFVTNILDFDTVDFDNAGIDGADPNYDWGFSTDKGGTTRTGIYGAGWSIGPYEYD